MYSATEGDRTTHTVSLVPLPSGNELIDFARQEREVIPIQSDGKGFIYTPSDTTSQNPSRHISAWLNFVGEFRMQTSLLNPNNTNRIQEIQETTLADKIEFWRVINRKLPGSDLSLAFYSHLEGVLAQDGNSADLLASLRSQANAA